VDGVQELIRLARLARGWAYAPYSNFTVGAALLTDSGRVYTGCNVENVSYGLTVCAERVAFFKAVSEGERKFQAVAVVSETGVTPCGACRQVLAEFNEDMKVILARPEGDWYEVLQLSDLLPYCFKSIQ